MSKHFLKALGFALVALSALAIATFSPNLAFAQQPTATETPVPKGSATATPTISPTFQAPTLPKVAPPASPNNLLGRLRRLGLTAGLVVENRGDSLSLRLGRATQQLKIRSNTLIVVPGFKNARVSDIKVRDRVIADLRGSENSVPTLVLDFPQGYTADNVMLGLVAVNARGRAVLRTRNGLQDITPNPTTVVVNMLGKQPALGTIKDARRGEAVIVIGQRSRGRFNPQVILLLNRAALQAGGTHNQPGATPTP